MSLINLSEEPTKKSLLITDFLVSAGGVLIDPNERQVLILKHLSSGEYLLPKGMNEVNESIEETAVREVYEETGYLNELSEPAQLLAIQIRPHVNGHEGQYKVIYWYYNRLISNRKHCGTQEEYEDFQSEWYALEDALKVLTYDEDKRLVHYAFEQARSTNIVAPDTIKQKCSIDSVYSAYSCGTLRIMQLNTHLIRSIALVTLNASEGKVMLCVLSNGVHRLSNTYTEREQHICSKQKPLAFQITVQDNSNSYQIIEWYIVSKDKDVGHSESADQPIRWCLFNDALVLLSNNCEIDILKLALTLI